MANTIESTKRSLSLMKQLGMDENVAMPLVTDLVEHYDEPQRFYHNLGHIDALLQHFEPIQPQLNEPLAIELAIFYHDVIYDPKRSDNELQSANFFEKQLTPYLPETLLNKVRGLILATQRHTFNDLENSDMAYFLDMDLAILGSPPTVYQAYAVAIRHEYHHIADKEYKQGRANVLTHFLQRPRLFFSDSFYVRFECQARINLAWELDQLQG